MPIYQSPLDFPDRVESAVEDELQDGENLLAAMPRSGEGFLAKYSKYYLLTPERFVEFTKAPFGGIKSESTYLETVSRVAIEASAINVNIELEGSGFSDEYKIQDPDRTGDAEEFAKMVRQRAAENL